MARFRDRRDAGRRLAPLLAKYRDDDTVVLALPRGGVSVGYEIARSLELPFDVFIVRKLGVPGYEELAMGVVATGNVRVLNREILRGLCVSETLVEQSTRRAERALVRSEMRYRGNRSSLSVAGRTVILVDDGSIDSATRRAAIAALRRAGAARVIAAIPIASPAACQEIARDADEVVCTMAALPLAALASGYDDSSEPSDEKIRSLLGQAVEEGEEMRCEDIMKRHVECLRENDSAQTAARLMRDQNVGFLPVCDANHQVLGTVTDRDLCIRVCAEDTVPSQVKASEIMTREVIACRPGDDLHIAERLMAQHHKSRIMVTDDDCVIQGVISLSDIAEREDEWQAANTLREVASREARVH